MITESDNNTTLDNQTEGKVEILVDYKDVKSLARYVSERGKIIPSRVNNIPIKKQREISRAIKRARVLALMPFVSDK
ncbi:MAG: 30S ribosomal protein S18 [Holosporales bacterium]|jgi:small subunit ribosomal protein S18|nr:30S ribosomal protein S18 [Holosporales bacterium]